MGIIRNFIDITGITPEEELQKKISGHIVQYPEIDYIYVPEDKQRINSIYQIFINVEIKSNRTINTAVGKIMILDGIKKIKLIYTAKGKTDKVNMLVLERPYNTFVEIPKGAKIVRNIDINIVDAYFSLVDSRKIYSHILYMINVNCDNNSSEEDDYYYNNLNSKREDIVNSKEDNRLSDKVENESVVED